MCQCLLSIDKTKDTSNKYTHLAGNNACDKRSLSWSVFTETDNVSFLVDESSFLFRDDSWRLLKTSTENLALFLFLRGVGDLIVIDELSSGISAGSVSKGKVFKHFSLLRFSSLFFRKGGTKTRTSGITLIKQKQKYITVELRYNANCGARSKLAL